MHRAAYRACAAAMETEQRAAAALEDAREHQCETHERLLQSLDFESGTGEAAALYQRRSALESVRTRLRTQQAQLTGAALAIGDPMALKSEHAQLLEQRDALERQYAGACACDRDARPRRCRAAEPLFPAACAEGGRLHGLPHRRPLRRARARARPVGQGAQRR
ncbi:MAG: hypothetical protein ACLUNO_05310 [Oscillospiraceae bacterium]